MAVTCSLDLDREEQKSVKGLNACASALFNYKFCHIDYPTTMDHTDVFKAWDQPRADLFIKKITMFENWVRMNEMMNSEDDDDIEY